jgi:hypothetical protein
MDKHKSIRKKIKGAAGEIFIKNSARTKYSLNGNSENA